MKDNEAEKMTRGEDNALLKLKNITFMRTCERKDMIIKYMIKDVLTPGIRNFLLYDAIYKKNIFFYPFILRSKTVLDDCLHFITLIRIARLNEKR